MEIFFNYKEFYFIYLKKEILKECMEIFGIFMLVYLNIFLLIYALLEIFFNLFISNLFEYDYIRNFKFSNFLIFYIVIVKFYFVYGKTLVFSVFWRNEGYLKSEVFWVIKCFKY